MSAFTQPAEIKPESMPSGLRLTPADMMWSITVGVSQILYKADEAVRQNPALARMMKHDPDIILAMMVRQLAVSGLPWVIEPEDENDSTAAAQAAAIALAVERIPRLRQMLNHLSRAYWLGCSGVSLDYKRGDPIVGEASIDQTDPDAATVAAEITVYPTAFSPVSGDSIMFDRVGNVAIRTGLWQEGGFGQAQRIISPQGPAALLDAGQRSSMVVNVWNIEAPDHDDPFTADRMYGGMGLRSLLWYAWFNKQLVQQAGRHYAERLARGTTVWFYQSGSEESKAQAEAGLAAMHSTYGVVYPFAEGMPPDPVKIYEAQGTGYQIFGDLEKREADKIIKAILYQELVTDTAPTGLGSGVADQHAKTFSMVVDYDAKCLEDALTSDLVRPMSLANFGEKAPRLRFRFVRPGETDDADSKIDRAEKLVRMGVELSVEELRKAGGYRKPGPNEETVGGAEETDPVDDITDRLLNRSRGE